MKISTSLADRTFQQRRESKQQQSVHRLRAQRVAELMLQGVDDLKEYAENMHFVSAVDDLDPAKACSERNLEESFQTLKDYDAKRLLAGIRASTIMTEYRRKVLLQSLAYGTTAHGKNAAQKLRRFSELKEIRAQSQDLSSREYSLSSSSGKKDLRGAINELCGHQSDRDIHPKWIEYEKMRKRWKYMRPTAQNLSKSKNKFSGSSIGPNMQ
jgi:hypothetical protein